MSVVHKDTWVEGRQQMVKIRSPPALKNVGLENCRVRSFGCEDTCTVSDCAWTFEGRWKSRRGE